ncbi:MAG: hypothetical protein ACYDAD_15530 [Acidimicrobiales bacterium]
MAAKATSSDRPSTPIGRRQAAGSANAALQGAFVDIGRGFLRVMGRIKTTVLLGFTIAAYNTDRIRAFRRKHRIETAEEPAVELPPLVVRRANLSVAGGGRGTPSMSAYTRERMPVGGCD